MRTDPSCLEGCGGEHTQLFVLLPTPHTLLMAVVAAAVATVVVPSCLSLWLLWEVATTAALTMVLARHILKPLVDFSCNELLKMIFFYTNNSYNILSCTLHTVYIKKCILMKPIRQLQTNFRVVKEYAEPKSQVAVSEQRDDLSKVRKSCVPGS